MSSDTTAFGRRTAPHQPAVQRRTLGASGLFIIAAFAVVAMLYARWRFAGEYPSASPPAWILGRGDVWASDPASVARGWAPFWLVIALSGLLAGLIGWWAARTRVGKLKFLPTYLQGSLAYFAVFLSFHFPKALSGPLFGAKTINPIRIIEGVLNGLLQGLGVAVIELLFGGIIVLGVGLLLWIGPTVLIANALDRLVPRPNAGPAEPSASGGTRAAVQDAQDGAGRGRRGP